MKSIFAFTILLFCLSFAFGQNEQSPIVEKEINYKNWTYKTVQTGEDLNLRDFTKGKKLVMVVYFAPWCPNWRHDAPMLQGLYDKYHAMGLDIVAVGEYDPVASMKANLDTMKITFPAVYESENRTEKQKTLHYAYRNSTGDTRGWGSPWSASHTSLPNAATRIARIWIRRTSRSSTACAPFSTDGIFSRWRRRCCSHCTAALRRSRS